jgi:carbon monoxide dehydrogenase subunit G
MEQEESETPSEEKSSELTFEDTVEIDATKAEVWETISDPEVLATCIPGAENVERLSERVYVVEITRGLSSLTISLEGEVELVELDEPDWIVASGEAYDSRSHSDFEGLAAMEMSRTDSETVEIGYKAELTFSGGVASIPNRVVGRLISSDVDGYFENVKETVDGR